MKVSNKLRSFTQFAVQDGVTEAVSRTWIYLYNKFGEDFVREYVVPWIGKNPELYRAYADFHPGFSDADPFKLILVSPHRITHTSKKSGEQLYGRVVGGCWDSPTDSLVENDAYRGLQEYIRTGDPDKYIKEFIKKRQLAGWEYSSSNPVLDRLHDIDLLIESVRKNGYLLQSETCDDNMRGDYSSDRPDIINEVTVSIGRDGTLYYNWMGGSHRLFISQIIDIGYIPVQVALRHTRWQQIRDTIRRSDTISDVPTKYRNFLAHPDIRDIHPKC